MIQTKKNTAGRVVFAIPNSREFLFFVPSKFDRSLNLLKETMWFSVDNPTYGECYRAASCVEALVHLKSLLGTLSLSSEVAQWYKEVTSIEEINPIEDLPLFEFQRQGVGFLVKRRRAMLSFSPGLGKTVTSITAANLLPKIHRILVVAPVSLLYMWKSEIEKWSDVWVRRPRIIIWHKIIDTAPLRGSNPDNSIYWIITNPETLRQTDRFLKSNFDIMILDESILFKNRKAKRTKTVETLAKKIPIVWELTGAPANRMLDDLWSQFHILNPKAYASYWRFAGLYCMTSNAGWGNAVLANKLGSEEEIKKRFSDIYYARSQEEVLDIPEWIFENIDIQMTPYQEKIYKELSHFLYTVIENEETNDSRSIAINSHLEKVIRLVQAASNPILLDGDNSSGKWDMIPDFLKMYPPPFIFWTSFIRSNLALKTLLASEGLTVGNMIGETLPVDRQKVVDSFQAGRLDAIVVGQAVGSFGHTLTKARTAFYPERNFDGSYFQSLHRFRRIGTTLSPLVVNLLSVTSTGGKTIDHLVNSLLDYRVQMIQNLTTGMLKEIL